MYALIEIAARVPWVANRVRTRVSGVELRSFAGSFLSHIQISYQYPNIWTQMAIYRLRLRGRGYINTDSGAICRLAQGGGDLGYSYLKRKEGGWTVSLWVAYRPFIFLTAKNIAKRSFGQAQFRPSAVSFFRFCEICVDGMGSVGWWLGRDDYEG